MSQYKSLRIFIHEMHSHHAGVNGSALFVQTEINAVKLSDTACSFQVVYMKMYIYK